MGINKRVFQEHRQYEQSNAERFLDEIDKFFTSNEINIDVRVTYQLPIKVLENVPKLILKDKIRKEMISRFRKKLTRQLNDQI